MILTLRIKAWWLSCSIAHAAAVLAQQEAELEQATTLYLAKLERLRKLRIEIATRAAPSVVLTEAIFEADRKRGLL